MDVKLSRDEIKLIASEVVKQLGASGLNLKGSTNGSAKASRSSALTSTRKAPVSAGADGALSYGIDAAAEEVSQHPNTIRRHIKSGRLKAKLVNGSYQIKQRDLERYARS